MSAKDLIKMGVLAQKQHWLKTKALFGNRIIAYIPSIDSSGTVAKDYGANGLNGTYANATLMAKMGNFGRPIPLFSGTSSYLSLNTAAFRAAFSKSEGTYIGTFAVDAVETWSDSTQRDLMFILIDGNNYWLLRKNTTALTLTAECRFNNVSEANVSTLTGFGTSYFTYIMSWSASNDRVRFYWNGEMLSESATLGAVSASNLATAYLCATNSGANYWKGYAESHIFLNNEITPAEARRYVAFSKNRITRIAFLGDSITYGANSGWASQVSQIYRDGYCSRVNHAIANTGIVYGDPNMATQASNASGDAADKIIIFLGTNDDNAGNMATLQAAYEAGIIALKASNPTATIYSANVLPRWTNNTGATPVDKGNIRTAIAAACTAQGVTCWDTYTDPWIAAADTSDGLHPTAAGHAKIATEVLARI